MRMTIRVKQTEPRMGKWKDLDAAMQAFLKKEFGKETAEKHARVTAAFSLERSNLGLLQVRRCRHCCCCWWW